MQIKQPEQKESTRTFEAFLSTQPEFYKAVHISQATKTFWYYSSFNSTPLPIHL